MKEFKFIKDKPFQYYGFMSAAMLSNALAVKDKSKVIVVTMAMFTAKTVREILKYPHATSFNLTVPFETDDYVELFGRLKELKDANPEIDTVIFQCEYGVARSRSMAMILSTLTGVPTRFWISRKGVPHMRETPPSVMETHSYQFVEDRLKIVFDSI